VNQIEAATLYAMSTKKQVYASGTSEGASLGWDVRGRTGKKIHQGVTNGIRVAQRLAKGNTTDADTAAKSASELQQIKERAVSKGQYSRSDVGKIMKIADRHTKIGMKQNPDDEGRRSSHDTLADHLVNGAQEAEWEG
jgi:hypothetical protein